MFFRPNNTLLLADTKLESTYKSLELTTATRLSTILLSSMRSYKDYDQTSVTTQHSINQSCSESVKFDIELISVFRTELQLHVKKKLLIQQS